MPIYRLLAGGYEECFSWEKTFVFWPGCHGVGISGGSSGRTPVGSALIDEEASNGHRLAQYHNILGIGAHPDDVEIGCGGSLVAAKRGGASIHAVSLSRCDEEMPAIRKGQREEEFFAASAIIGAKAHTFDVPDREFPEHRREIMLLLENLQEQLRPDLVFFPSLDDPHQDHDTVAHAVVRTFRRKETLLQYEILRHGSHSFTPTLFVDITATLDTKLRALGEYKSQLESRAYFDEDSFRSLARTRGAQSGCEYAEGFMVQMLYL
ncbi:MAG: PIG-L family deacetylase [Methanobacteriota archaeon]|nr:MAG: PIG-L family deacetylase [Euryarchaeota archaeon]